MKNSSILLIYTGGTIGMMEDAATGALIPFDFGNLMDYVPELRRFKFDIDIVAFETPIDSSDVTLNTWKEIARLIEVNYNHFDGFVVLHGTDTMAYSASALGFMLQGLTKPVIFTGSQLPIGKLRTDGKENLITSIEIAASTRNGEPVVQEVAVYFESQLFRGNRTHKYNTENFDAFESANFSCLAEVGIHITFHYRRMWRSEKKDLEVQYGLDNSVGVLKIFPGMNMSIVNGILKASGLKALVLETFGSGNASRHSEFTDAIAEAIERGMVIVNISQCNKGFVEQGRYETSSALLKSGVIGGGDMTTEAALTKLMYLLGQGYAGIELKNLLVTPLRGELTVSSDLLGVD
jgi:L-asparaginase